MSDVKVRLRISALFIFANHNKFLLLGLGPCHIITQVSRGSDISNILEYPKQFQLYSFLFQHLGPIHDLMGFSDGLGSHLQLCPL